MNIHEIVKKLVGEINPVGETNTDNERFKNLKVMTDLVSRLVYDIDTVGMKKDRAEYSIKRAGEFADTFLEHDLGIVE